MGTERVSPHKFPVPILSITNSVSAERGAGRRFAIQILAAPHSVYTRILHVKFIPYVRIYIHVIYTSFRAELSLKRSRRSEFACSGDGGWGYAGGACRTGRVVAAAAAAAAADASLKAAHRPRPIFSLRGSDTPQTDAACVPPPPP